MRRTPSIPGLIAGLLCCACAPPPPRSHPELPNVVLILCDDAGWGSFGCYGNEAVPTPHIDSIARRGVLCSQGYVTSPSCSPSRAGLITGRHPSRFGHEYNFSRVLVTGPIGRSIGLPRGERTLAEALRERGYRTGLIGKWHLGVADEFHPLNRGFDEFVGFLLGPATYSGHGRPAKLAEAGGGELAAWKTKLLVRGREPAGWKGHLTDFLAKEAVEFIGDSRGRPFFLFLSLLAPHAPLHPSSRDAAALAHVPDETRRGYLGLVAGLDRAVGRVLEALEEEGLDEDTLLFFISDNGADRKTGFNGPLRAGKGYHFEGGLRVPYLVQWPARIPGDQRFDSPVSTLDVFPTALAAAGGELSAALEGRDLLPYLTADVEGVPHEVLCWRTGDNGAIRRGRWKLVLDGAEPIALFDVEEDRGETDNRMLDEPTVVAELAGAHGEWDRQRFGPRWKTRSNPSMRQHVGRLR